MMRIALVHGWGYDAALWHKVVSLLDDCDVEVCDLGFFGAPQLPAPCDGPRIAVGHSFGTLWWLALTDQPWARLVAINGFPRFTAAADFPQGVTPRVLERMKKRFAVAPAAVLADFHAACGGAGRALPADMAALAKGLATLGELDARPQWHSRADDIRLLAGRRDAIVPTAQTEHAARLLREGSLRWIENGGHLLPLTHPRECAAFIREAAA